jgi:hypothetical protein
VQTITSGYSAGQTLQVYAGFTGGTATAGDFLYCYGAQVEMSATASSYILTGGSTAVGGDWDAHDIKQLDLAAGYECGYYTAEGDQVTAAALLDQLWSGVGAWWSTDANGVVKVQQLQAPAFTSSSATLSQETDIDGMEQVPSSDDNNGLPIYRVALSYSHNYTPLTPDALAGAVSDADKALFGKEWLTAESVDTSVQTGYPLAGARIEQSLITNETDAQTEADRRLALFKVKTKWFDVPVWMSETMLSLELGDTVTLDTTRYGGGFLSGVNHRILGIEPDGSRGQIRLTIWK